MKKNRITYPETVMFIDAVLLSAIVRDFKKNFEERLQRPLQEMDVAQFLVNLALDAKMLPGDHQEIQVFFMYDKSEPQLSHCVPSDLKKELDEVAFQDSLGEFGISSLPADITMPREDLFFSFLSVMSGWSDVKRVIAVPFDQNNEEIHTVLEAIKGKEVFLFGMNKPEREISYTWQLLAYPVMQAMGIKGDEIP